MRDFEKWRDKGREIISAKRDLSAIEILELLGAFDEDAQAASFKNALYNLIENAFYTGVAVGYKQARNEAKKKPRRREL